MEKPIIQIGFDKNGDADFSVSGTMGGLSFEELKALRAMIPVAIYVAEDMWRRNNPPPMPSKVASP